MKNDKVVSETQFTINKFTAADTERPVECAFLAFSSSPYEYSRSKKQIYLFDIKNTRIIFTASR